MNYTTKIKLMEESELPTQDQWDAMSMFQQNYFHNNLIIEQTAKLKNNFKDKNYLLRFSTKKLQQRNRHFHHSVWVPTSNIIWNMW